MQQTQLFKVSFTCQKPLVRVREAAPLQNSTLFQSIYEYRGAFDKTIKTRISLSKSNLHSESILPWSTVYSRCVCEREADCDSTFPIILQDVWLYFNGQHEVHTQPRRQWICELIHSALVLCVWSLQCCQWSTINPEILWDPHSRSANSLVPPLSSLFTFFFVLLLLVDLGHLLVEVLQLLGGEAHDGAAAGITSALLSLDCCES